MILTLLVLSLILLSQQGNNFYNRNENNSEIKIEPHLSAPDSLKVDWYRTWGSINKHLKYDFTEKSGFVNF